MACRPVVASVSLARASKESQYSKGPEVLTGTQGPKPLATLAVPMLGKTELQKEDEIALWRRLQEHMPYRCTKVSAIPGSVVELLPQSAISNLVRNGALMSARWEALPHKYSGPESKSCCYRSLFEAAHVTGFIFLGAIGRERGPLPVYYGFALDYVQWTWSFHTWLQVEGVNYDIEFPVSRKCAYFGAPCQCDHCNILEILTAQ